MADLVIDYELLYQAATQLGTLESEFSTLSSLPKELFDEYGTGVVGSALALFCMGWKEPLKNAADQMKQLQSTFKGVAQAFFEADAAQTAAINAGVATSAARNYPAEFAAYQVAIAEWNAFQPLSTSTAQTSNGSENPQVPKPTPPPKPVNPYTGPTGAVTTYTTGGVDPVSPTLGELITSESTTYSSGGLSYSEQTTFGADKGWVNGSPVQDTTTTITHSDGSTDTITTDLNTDGSATATDVSSTGTTTTSTRANWDASWVSKTTDTGGTSGTGNGDSGSSHSDGGGNGSESGSGSGSGASNTNEH